MTGTGGPGGTTPEEVTDDMLMALADGELSGETAAELRRRIAGDPELAARFALFETGAADLRAAFDPGPVPDRLLRAIADTPMGTTGGTVTPLRRRAAAGLARPGGAGAARLAMAASVILALATGFLAGRNLAPSAPGGLATDRAGAAAGALAALPTGGETTLATGVTARVLGSFQTDRGLCRMIAIRDGAAEDRAVICAAGSDWTVALRVQAGGEGGFVTASDDTAGVIDAFLDRIGAGAALTPDEEAAALAP